MPFHVLIGEQGGDTWEPVTCWQDGGNLPAVWDTGAEASAYAKEQNDAAKRYLRGTRYRVKKIPDAEAEGWKEREAGRLASGEYQPVPWQDMFWNIPEHYCHLSKSKPGFVAFTPGASFGMADRQLRMRAGRYLRKFYSVPLSEADIAEWAAKAGHEAAPAGLQFATDPDDIVEVYLNGPRSCMAHEADHYADGHPCRVYGAGDLAVAYINRGVADYEDDDARVTARVVCWPEKKWYGRIYGDITRLKPLLEAEGYTRASVFEGARLIRIKYGNGQFVCPYMDDDNDFVEDNGEYLIVREFGEMSTKNEGGVTAWMCPNCEDYADRDESMYIEDAGESWCDYCTTNYAHMCWDCGEYHNHSALITANDEYVCERCEDNYTYCGGCEEYYPNGEVTHQAADGGVVCDGCAEAGERQPCGVVSLPGQDDCACNECVDHQAQMELELELEQE